MRTLKIFSDGASSGNPGDAGYGFVIRDGSDRTIIEGSGYIGEATCNAAEYIALLRALEAAAEIDSNAFLELFTDSQLLANQITGRYRVLSENLKPLFDETLSKLRSFSGYRLVNIPRVENKQADKLARAAIKRKRGEK